ncbi:molybdopterin-containing oxidoreductase family membrane subunit [Halorubrum alkaliphilum]|uniref:Molybdopterin-containing oxidoreductase family membrane subunit n=1 Tax=Halorubrum alkaliphilum TaxID=261290 RepID=A0A8T4GIH3_9EURY|nr:NrfD/PsrC family molybdoenzyme membrane anchor subunit [Halorubrum alkaliphilum]MBP1923221.1 molybdopterin-containing oxidoreductase family membrane subunit [Halorubrum alkaliphilum]
MSHAEGETVVSSLKSSGKRYYAWLAFIGLGFLIGGYGVLVTLIEGTSVLGITGQVPWGILISTYVFFALLSTGICIGITSLSSVFGMERYEPLVKRGVLLSLITLAAGGAVIMAGLGQPVRAIPAMVLSPNPSAPMWWMIVLYSVYGGALVAEFVLIDRVDDPPRRLSRTVAVVALIAPILAGATLGAIFGTAEARPYYGGLFASVFLLVTAVASGVALITAVTVIERKLSSATEAVVSEELITRTLGKYLGVATAAVFLVTGLRHAYGLTATNEALATAHQQMLFGGTGLWAVGIGMGVGLLVPMVLMAVPRTRTVGGVLAASVLVLVGMFVSRLEFVLGGQVVALTNDPSNQFPIASYAPSAAELAIVVMGFALFAGLYTAGRALFDLDELPHHEEDTMSHTTHVPDGGETDE